MSDYGWPQAGSASPRFHWGDDVSSLLRSENFGSQATASQQRPQYVPRGIGGWSGEPSGFVGYKWKTIAASSTFGESIYSEELDLFVMLTSRANLKVATSVDGIEWTYRSTANYSWTDVCWSRELGLFVAVGNSGTGDRVMSSPDGIEWTTRTTPADNSWNAVCWSGDLGLFVAVASSGTGNRVMTSPDGVTWTIGSTPSDSIWSGVAWSPRLRLFVAVATTSSHVMTSPDGLTWTTRSPSHVSEWTDVCWSEDVGAFVAVAEGGNGPRIMFSRDAVTWQGSGGAGGSVQFGGVIWIKELSFFLAIAYFPTSGASFDSFWISRDGIDFGTAPISPGDGGYTSAAYSTKRRILIAGNAVGGYQRIAVSGISP